MENRFEQLWKHYEQLAVMEYGDRMTPGMVVESQSKVLDLGIRIAQAQAFHERDQPVRIG